MFHCFYLSEMDKNFVRYFWYKDNDPSKDLVEMRALVHIFGNKASPSIANHGLRTAASLGNGNELVKSLIINNTYVDDSLGATNSVHDAVETIKLARTLLENYGINMHKVASNSHQVLQHFPENVLRKKEFNDDKNVCSTLGIMWYLEEDTLGISINISKCNFTKRGVISTINSIYDPLGICALLILKGRLIQSDTLARITSGLAGFDWDDPLPSHFLSQWEEWVESLDDLSLVKVSRSYYPSTFSSYNLQEIYVYCDAIYLSVGYVIYMRNFRDNWVNVSFITAGSKLAPRAATTVPRLELCAALEGSKAAYEVRRVIFIQVIFFSSLIVRWYLDICQIVVVILRDTLPEEWNSSIISLKIQIGFMLTLP